MGFPFLALLLVTIAVQAITLLLAPKSKKTKPEPAKDLEDPVAEAGIPVPVIFGTITVQGPNVLWFGDKASRTYKVNA